MTRNAEEPTAALDVTWTAPDTTGTAPVTGYALQYRELGATKWINISITGTKTQTTIGGLSSGTTFEVQVLARSGKGNSPWSDSGNGATANPAPELVTGPGESLISNPNAPQRILWRGEVGQAGLTLPERSASDAGDESDWAAVDLPAAGPGTQAAPVAPGFGSSRSPLDVRDWRLSFSPWLWFLLLALIPLFLLFTFRRRRKQPRYWY